MTEKVKMNDGTLADELKIPRPDLVLDEFFSEPERIYTGDSDGLRQAAEELIRRRQTQK